MDFHHHGDFDTRCIEVLYEIKLSPLLGNKKGWLLKGKCRQSLSSDCSEKCMAIMIDLQDLSKRKNNRTQQIKNYSETYKYSSSKDILKNKNCEKGKRK